MNAWTIGLIVATTVGTLTAGMVLVVAYYRIKHTFYLRVAHEKAAGNTRLRRRMANLAGRGMNPDVVRHVTRAETMPGWVWITVTNLPRTPKVEALGWAPTRWAARRAVARQAGRNERGEVTETLLLVFGLLFLAAFLGDALTGWTSEGILRAIFGAVEHLLSWMVDEFRALIGV